MDLRICDVEKLKIPGLTKSKEDQYPDDLMKKLNKHMAASLDRILTNHANAHVLFRMEPPADKSHMDHPAILTYLSCFTTEHENQHHKCMNCLRFLIRASLMIAIDQNGVATPVLWDPENAKPAIKPIVQAMYNLVMECIDDPSYRLETLSERMVHDYSSNQAAMWGLPKNRSARTGTVWKHLHVDLVEYMNKGMPAAGERDMAPEAYRQSKEWQNVGIKNGYAGDVAQLDSAIGYLEARSDARETQRKLLPTIRAYKRIAAIIADKDISSTQRRLKLAGIAAKYARSSIMYISGSNAGDFLNAFKTSPDGAFSLAVQRFDPLLYKRVQRELTEKEGKRMAEELRKEGYEDALFRRQPNIDEIPVEHLIYKEPLAKEVEDEKPAGLDMYLEKEEKPALVVVGNKTPVRITLKDLLPKLKEAVKVEIPMTAGFSPAYPSMPAREIEEGKELFLAKHGWAGLCVMPPKLSYHNYQGLTVFSNATVKAILHNPLTWTDEYSNAVDHTALKIMVGIERSDITSDPHELASPEAAGAGLFVDLMVPFAHHNRRLMEDLQNRLPLENTEDNLVYIQMGTASQHKIRVTTETTETTYQLISVA